MSFPSVTRSAARTALRSATKQVAEKQAVRSIALAASQRGAALSSAKVASQATAPSFAIQKRGVKTIDFAGTEEKVYERADWPLEKVRRPAFEGYESVC